jgi:hypothetical protein
MICKKNKLLNITILSRREHNLQINAFATPFADSHQRSVNMSTEICSTTSKCCSNETQLGMYLLATDDIELMARETIMPVHTYLDTMRLTFDGEFCSFSTTLFSRYS